MAPSSQSGWTFVPLRYGLTFWEFKSPGFYGTVEDHGGEWVARRAGDVCVPPVGRGDDLEEMKALIESWARSHLRWQVESGMEMAARAQRALLEMREERMSRSGG